MNNIGNITNRYSFVHFINGIIMGLIAPIMYVVLRDKGFEIFEIGFLIIISSITTVLSEIPCGMLSDRIGRKKMYIGGQLTFILFCLGMIYIDTMDIMILAMVAAGFSTAMTSGTLDALFVDTLNKHNIIPETLQKSLAKVGGISMLGLFVGAILSGVFASFNLPGKNTSSFENNYVIAASLIPLLLILANRLIEETYEAKGINATQSVSFISQIDSAFVNLKQSQSLLLMMLSSSLGAIAMISFEKFWQLELRELTQNEDMKWMFGTLFSVSLIIAGFGQALSAKLCQCFNNNYVHSLIFIRILQGSLFIILFMDHSLFSFSIVFMLIFFVSALSQSPVMTLFHHEVKDSERSTMLSMRSVFLQLGAVIGIIMASFSTHFVSLKFAFIISATVYFMSISVLLSKQLLGLGDKLSQLNDKPQLETK